MRKKSREAPRCQAPIDDVPDDSLEGVRLCGEPATEERTVEGLVWRLCAEHAAEVDRDEMEDDEMTTETTTTAATVARIMGDDGQVFVSADGRDLGDVAYEHGARLERGEGAQWDAYRLAFPDGSAIVVVGNAAWDVEGSEPWSWAGAE